ncbi:hypothetical protein AMK68_05105 [candidate division KD3-62 bacterium DG_56]|uniref:Uncharacterized protein n=1 Tax=candidate division KD3-62 bacterium DG_56 TaxID=1704032 RepID=A0A0S7XIJ9_9BACT|nr:MAG: hypothetical protein AMK68_05105 [candidate division KD3-62 bacterium DG_56]
MIAGAALIALLVGSAAVWARLQSDSPWPMFQRDLRHSGRSGLKGPDSWEVRWYHQTSNSITASPVMTDSNGARRCYYLRWEDGPTPNNFTPALLMSPSGPDLTETAHILPAVAVGQGQTEVATWVTAQGDPDEDSLPVGDWRFVVHGASSSDESATLFFKVYGLTHDGEDRQLLFETAVRDRPERSPEYQRRHCRGTSHRHRVDRYGCL